MRGSTQDLKDALTLVETVKRDAPSSWQMESDIEAMYEVGWDSKRFCGRGIWGFASTTSWFIWSYSYNIGYNNTYSDIATGWLKEDPRYESGHGFCPGSRLGIQRWCLLRWNYIMEDGMIQKMLHTRPIISAMPSCILWNRSWKPVWMIILWKKQTAFKWYAGMPDKPCVTGFISRSKKDLLSDIPGNLGRTVLENGSEYFASLRFINDTDASAAQNKPWIYTETGCEFTENQYCWPIQRTNG